MRAGLAASTVTPGSTAPVVSFTSPAIAPLVADCARAAAGASRIAHRVMMRVVIAGPFVIGPPHGDRCCALVIPESLVAGVGGSIPLIPLHRCAEKAGARR